MFLLLLLVAPCSAVSWGKGTNLGNTLEAPTEGSWAPAAQEKFFDDFKAAGFEAVRIPVRWDNHTGTSAPYTIDPKFLARVHTVVGWCLSKNFTCAINSHHDDWLDNQHSFDSLLPRFLAIWKQVAQSFASAPDRLVFEIYNEPHVMTADQLNTMNNETYHVMRESNPTRVIMYGSLGWYGIWWILQNPTAMKMPGDGSDPNVWLQVHDYDPFCFTTPQCGSPMITTWGTQKDVAAIHSSFDGLTAWAKEHQHNVPFLLGEFGATVQQPCKSCRQLWYETYYAAVEQPNSVGFSVWDDDGWFQVYNRANGKWDSMVLKALHVGGNNPACTDPNNGKTSDGTPCATQKAYGNCGASWMEGWCCKTCFNCTAGCGK